MDTHPTERRFPRTLNEAFPHTMEYGACIFIYPRAKTGYAYVAVTLSVAIALVLIVRNLCILS